MSTKVQDHLQPQEEPSSIPSSTTTATTMTTTDAVIHNDFSHLQLSTAGSSINNLSPSSTTADISNDPSQVIISDDHCTKCGNPMKRRSPSTSSPLEFSTPCNISPQLKPKGLFASTSTKNSSLSGYRVIPLPTAFPNSSFPTLGRTTSSPRTSIVPSDINSPPEIVGSASPASRDLSGTRPPLPPLARSISDPSPFFITTPPRQNTAPAQNVMRPRKGSRSPSSGDSGSGKNGDESPAKRLKRKCDKMREIKQWFDELVRESEQDDTSEASAEMAYYSAKEINNEEKNTNGGSEIDVDEALEEEDEATVSTERDGNAINIHYKCRCGAGCAIRLVGQNIYYKLA